MHGGSLSQWMLPGHDGRLLFRLGAAREGSRSLPGPRMLGISPLPVFQIENSLSGCHSNIDSRAGEQLKKKSLPVGIRFLRKRPVQTAGGS